MLDHVGVNDLLTNAKKVIWKYIILLNQIFELKFDM